MKKIETISKEHLHIFNHLSKEKINTYLKEASYRGDFQLMWYLLASPELTQHADIHHENDYCLINACWNGDLKTVRFLLTSPDLKEHADIHARKGMALQVACAAGKLSVVKFLLSSSLLKEKSNIHDKDDIAIKSASYKGYIEIVEFLSKSNKIKTHANIHTDNDYCFHFACEQKNYTIAQFLLENANEDTIFDKLLNSKNIDFVQNLIFEYGLKKTPLLINYLEQVKKEEDDIFNPLSIKNFITNSKFHGRESQRKIRIKNNETINTNIIEKMFEVRDLRDSLKYNPNITVTDQYNTTQIRAKI